MNGLSKCLGWCLIAVVLSGCSIKLAYNNIDRLVRWQVDDYVDLDNHQEDYLEQQLEAFMLWHRRNHLPLYADYTLLLATQLTDNPKEESFEHIFDQFNIWSDEIEEKLMPTVIGIMHTLTDRQIADMAVNMEQSNLEYAEADIDAALEDIQERWADEVKDTFSRFAGRLTNDQNNYLQRRSSNYQPERVLWAGYRRRWQADLLALLELRGDRKVLTARYQQLVASREDYYGEMLLKVSNHNILLGRQVAAHLFSSMSSKQSARFVESLEDLAQDFSELSKQG